MGWQQPELAFPVADPERDEAWTRELDDEFGHFQEFAKRRVQAGPTGRSVDPQTRTPGEAPLSLAGDRLRWAATFEAMCLEAPARLGSAGGLDVKACRLAADIRREYGLPLRDGQL